MRPMPEIFPVARLALGVVINGRHDPVHQYRAAGHGNADVLRSRTQMPDAPERGHELNSVRFRVVPERSGHSRHKNITGTSSQSLQEDRPVGRTRSLGFTLTLLARYPRPKAACRAQRGPSIRLPAGVARPPPGAAQPQFRADLGDSLPQPLPGTEMSVGDFGLSI
jgi:hypothetical protein